MVIFSKKIFRGKNGACLGNYKNYNYFGGTIEKLQNGSNCVSGYTGLHTRLYAIYRPTRKYGESLNYFQKSRLQRLILGCQQICDSVVILDSLITGRLLNYIQTSRNVPIGLWHGCCLYLAYLRGTIVCSVNAVSFWSSHSDAPPCRTYRWTCKPCRITMPHHHAASTGYYSHKTRHCQTITIETK